MMEIYKAETTTRRIWPDEANRLVKKALASSDPCRNAALLVNQLAEMTGYDSRTCWRFLERNGIKRPVARQYTRLDPKVLHYIMENGYDLAAQRFRCTKTQLYSFVYRQERSIGHAAMYSIRRLSKVLSVRPEVVQRWVGTNLLEAHEVTTAARSSFIVSEEQLRRFLQAHAARLVPLRRFPEKRAQFLSNYLYDGKHMDLGLLRTRESKKEGDAFRNGEFRPAKKNQTADNIVRDTIA